MNAFKLFSAAGAIALMAGGANAAVYYADEVISFNKGTCTGNATQCASNDRLDPSNALGMENGEFVALGFGGDITLGFAKDFSSPKNVKVWEITFDPGREAGHFEAVDVYAVLGGATTLLGRLTNATMASSVTSNVAFDSIKLVDATWAEFGQNGTSSFDGFDVDAVSVAAVPLPAAGLMLLGGLGGLAMIRRRKKAAA